MTGSAKRDVHNPKAATNGAPSSRRVKAEPGLDRAIQAQIGSKLRAMYGELADQPVPDRFAAILGQLGGTRRGHGS